MSDVLVAVVCIAYNHEQYIRDALEGFLSQKTDFKFKVIVHDDASDDNTQDIFREVIMAKEADILFKQKKYRNIVLKNKYLRLFYKQYGLLRTCLLLVRAVSGHE